MFRFFAKILSIPNNVIDVKSFNVKDREIYAVGKKLESKIKKLFRGSLAIREIDAGSDNAIEQEMVALSNAFYDVERFGVHFVASPKHADMLMVTGPVAKNMKGALIRAYENTPDPKIVVAVGDDAIDGGIYKGSYAVCDGVNTVIPVDYNIPGDPPAPKEIISHLLKILETIDKKNNLTVTK